ncbi:hypothetical protein CMI40_01505 [Candidatus Pacearchaeota archaeon]|jgi:hypothetical protein|nr:hypothetical protein [Candidatus Pacearchaeota archaeon]|tara:strand:- start:2180 stop:2896 length:717 start_codon:yes stop_codon:yes gene_type:complete
MYKRGSHVGVMLSFVIFVTFLVFLYSVLEPVTQVERDKQFLLDYLKIELTKMSSTNLTSVTISINDSYDLSSKDCLRISHVSEVGGLNSIVKNENNTPINFQSSTNNIEWEHDNKRFFKIYYSEEQFTNFQIGLNGCLGPKEDEDYSIKLIKIDRYIFETKINSIATEHQNKYGALKGKLKIPIGSEFSFSLINSSRDIIAKTEEKDISVNIYVDEISIQYIDEEANINSGFLIIKVW